MGCQSELLGNAITVRKSLRLPGSEVPSAQGVSRDRVPNVPGRQCRAYIHEPLSLDLFRCLI